MITRPILILLLTSAIVVFALLAKWIVRLPSKYERHSQAVNPWSALDSGIDPTETERASS